MLKVINKTIMKLFPNLYKLNKLADAIDTVNVLPDGSVYIRYKNNVVTETIGSNYTYSKKGTNLIMANVVHLNPLYKDRMEYIENDFKDIVETMDQRTLDLKNKHKELTKK